MTCYSMLRDRKSYRRFQGEYSPGGVLPRHKYLTSMINCYMLENNNK